PSKTSGYNSEVSKYNSINQLLRTLFSYNGRSIVFIDSTGIKEKINLELDCKLDDIKQVQQSLKENGFNLIWGKKDMQVLVIRDDSKETVL
ncbi:MAG: hypothetical protein J7497_16655, partial [Chitinophagaceae bacterium]|nr:hypothetical protein [Chitinophagaceae bacterium]